MDRYEIYFLSILRKISWCQWMNLDHVFHKIPLFTSINSTAGTERSVWRYSLVSCDNFNIPLLRAVKLSRVKSRRLIKAYSIWMTAAWLACFQLHPKANSTGGKRTGVLKFSRNGRTKKSYHLHTHSPRVHIGKDHRSTVPFSLSPVDWTVLTKRKPFNISIPSLLQEKGKKKTKAV